jgi:hypothetical protein
MYFIGIFLDCVSARTLMIVVTLLAVPCAYIGWQATIVRERRAMSEAIKGIGVGPGGLYVDRALPDEADRAIPWIRKLLGDQAMRVILLAVTADNEYRHQVRELFPEAEITGYMIVGSQGHLGITTVPFPDEPQAE